MRVSNLCALFALCLLAACGRPLSPSERDLARSLYGADLAPDRVRIVDGHFARSFTFQYAKRPRVTCQERVFPPFEGDSVTTSPGAIALFNTVLVRKDLYRPDFARQYPQGTDLYDLMLFAHEMAHVWQWQNRKRTGYHPLKAAQEHAPGTDPYLFDLGQDPQFLSFPYEQQAAIIEEFICCRALAPKAKRTARLHRMLAQALPVTQMQSRIDALAVVPWRGAQVQGICD